MEHFKSPFGSSDFVTAQAVENQQFFDSLLSNAKYHRFYSHPFMSTFDTIGQTPDMAVFMLSSFYKIVSPFTGLLCSLGGRAPNLRSRFALMDNIFEEMGCGDLQSAHPSLYLKMLASIGVSPETAESMPTLPAIRRINDHLLQVVEHGNFAVACAVLASAEATIPPSFPVLAAIARNTFRDIDMTFFDRHGPRDAGHSDDASMLFALNGNSSDFAITEAAVKLDLDLRSDLLDEWVITASRGIAPRRVRLSERAPRPLSVRPMANHDSVPPPG